MDGYELAFWIAVAVIVALIVAIVWPDKQGEQYDDNEE